MAINITAESILDNALQNLESTQTKVLEAINHIKNTIAGANGYVQMNIISQQVFNEMIDAMITQIATERIIFQGEDIAEAVIIELKSLKGEA